MRTPPVYRRVATGAVLLVTLGGLPLMLTESAQAAVATLVTPAFDTCASTSDATTQTISLTGDCDTYTVLSVPDGWTLDGAGHTVTAVQDADHPSYVGAVVESASGDTSAAATMNVEDLAITTRGFDQFTQDTAFDSLYGIKMVGAGGTFTDVSVSGIAHASHGQVSRAFYVDNRASGSTDVPRANLSLDRVTITRFQKSGLYLRGNLAYDVRHLVVGPAAAVDGSPNTTNAANGVTVIDGAHGSLTDSRIGESRYATDDGGLPADVATSTSILLYNAGRTTLTRNVIAGTDGDVGVEVYNDTNNADTTATMTCSTLVRHDGGNADANAGFGVWDVEDSTAGAVHLTLGANTYRGWAGNVRGDSIQGSAPACTTGNHLSASASKVAFGAADVLTGAIRNADGSAATGSVILQSRENGTAVWTDAGSTPTTSTGGYSFRVAPDQRTSYRTTFSGDTFTDSTSNAVSVLVSSRISAHASRTHVRSAGLVRFTGTVGPRLAGYTAILQVRRNGHWVGIRQTVLTSASSYRFTWRARKAGHRYFRVHTQATPDHAAGWSRAMRVTVAR